MYRFDPSQFNERQLEAVLHDKGPALVLAGAGSGKTRIIAHRVAYLMAYRHVAPENIVAVSFTNKAARELRERVALLVGRDDAAKCHLSTFHSLGADILRQHITKLGWKMPFAILDTDEQIGIVKNVLKDMHLAGSSFEPFDVLKVISRIKSSHKSPLEFLPSHNPRRHTFAKIYDHYQEIRKSLNGIDFDDMISLPVEIFETHPDVLESYRNNWTYLLVDEYQDTNELQFRMLKLLCGCTRNIMVVGDDDQSIYAFRGADSAHILSFPSNFDDVHIIALEQNYRSTQIILDAANAVIAKNSKRHDKTLWSDVREGEVIHATACASPKAEAEFVCSQIQLLHASRDIPYRNIAVLYRTNPQSRVLEEEFVHSSMPYRVVGGSKFYDYAEVRDMVFYLRAAVSFHDEIALRRIINTPRRGISPESVGKIAAEAASDGISFFDAMRRFAAAGSLPPAANLKLGELVSVLERYHRRFMAASESMSIIMRDMIDDIHYRSYLQSSSTSDAQAAQRADNVDEFLDAMASFAQRESNSPSEFLQRVALEPPTKDDDPDRQPDAVTLMTIHASKGLEFETVFIVGCEENLLPHSNSLPKVMTGRAIPQDDAGIAEERRLFYVGMTRAKRRLHLTYSKVRRRLHDSLTITPSRFLRDIPSDKIEFATDSAPSASTVKLQNEKQDRVLSGIERMRALFNKK